MHRYQRYKDGTPILDAHWNFVKNIERDYGYAALKRAWKRVYKLLWDLDIKVEERCYARETGWEGKYPDSYRQWKENGFKNRKKFYKRATGKGRWHLHALISADTEIDELDLHRKISKILSTKNYYNVNIEKVRNLKAYKKYIKKNVSQTVKPKWLKRARLHGKSHENEEEMEELFLSQNNEQRLQPQRFTAIVIPIPLKQYNIVREKRERKRPCPIRPIESVHDPPFLFP
jgi:hypothetical protein